MVIATTPIPVVTLLIVIATHLTAIFFLRVAIKFFLVANIATGLFLGKGGLVTDQKAREKAPDELQAIDS